MSASKHNPPEGPEDGLGDGGPVAPSALTETLYRELHGIAQAQFRRQPGGVTLQPTAVIHEAFLKLAAQGGQMAMSRSHLLALASRVMRQILVDHWKARNAQKRGGGRERVYIEQMGTEQTERSSEVDVLDLHETLSELEAASPRKARIVEMRFFGGMTVPEIAEAMDISISTVESDWRLARAWLAARLKGSDQP